MSMMDRRRVVLAGAAGIAAALAACPATRLLAGGTLKPEPEFDYLVALEGHSGGRLGAAFLDGKSGKIVGHRIDERFTMCSTFKFSLAAAVLARIDAGTLDGAALVPVAKSDLVGHSPAVEAALGKGSLSILALAEAAQTVSDNAAANLLLARIGGPAGMTRFWRDLGDDVSRLDRNEPALNTSRGADIRDTSTPAAMARSMAAILTGKVMSTGSRERLIGWMAATKTGAGRLRVGLPAGWRAGDKTGTSGSSPDAPAFVNDIAAVWRPDGTPCFVTCFYDAPAGTSQGDREAVLAEVGRIAGGWMSA